MATKKDLIELLDERKKELLNSLSYPSSLGKKVQFTNLEAKKIIEDAFKKASPKAAVIEVDSYIGNYVRVYSKPRYTEKEVQSMKVGIDKERAKIIKEHKRLVILVKLSEKGSDVVEEVKRFIN